MNEGPITASETGQRCKPDYERLIARAKEREARLAALEEALEPFKDDVSVHREFPRYSFPEYFFMTTQELKNIRKDIARFMEEWENDKGE